MTGGLRGEGTFTDVPAGGVPGHESAERGTGAGARLLRLGELKVGERATVQGFDGGHSLVSRLSALGFTPQTQVVMRQNFGSGPVIVKVRDTRIALGRGEAMKVLVRV